MTTWWWWGSSSSRSLAHSSPWKAPPTSPSSSNASDNMSDYIWMVNFDWKPCGDCRGRLSPLSSHSQTSPPYVHILEVLPFTMINLMYPVIIILMINKLSWERKTSHCSPPQRAPPWSPIQRFLTMTMDRVSISSEDTVLSRIAIGCMFDRSLPGRLRQCSCQTKRQKTKD